MSPMILLGLFSPPFLGVTDDAVYECLSVNNNQI